MQKLLLLIDKISTKVGHVFAWAIVFLTLVICYEVFSRYVLNKPHPWVFDATYMPVSYTHLLVYCLISDTLRRNRQR